ncbi:MAG: XkdX family protein [Negativicutes bacterium]|nr:XkdX family protein [Negativicutes bacterium]
MFAIVKRYYDKGIYSNEDVEVFVRAGKLTETQYKEITGDDYVA